MKKVIAKGSLDLGGVKLDCYVLESGERVLSQRSIVGALTATGCEGGRKRVDLSVYLERAPAEMAALRAAAVMDFEVSAGNVAHGRTAEWFSQLVSGYALAFASGKLRKDQEHIGRQCIALTVALSGVAIVALIDEATGYQKVRASDELRGVYARMLRVAAGDHKVLWASDIVMSLCRTFRIPYDGVHYPVALNGVVGPIYKMVLGRDLHAEVKRRNPGGDKRAMHHQFFADELRSMAQVDLQIIKSISDTSANKYEFWARMRRHYRGDAVQLGLVEHAA